MGCCAGTPFTRCSCYDRAAAAAAVGPAAFDRRDGLAVAGSRAPQRIARRVRLSPPLLLLLRRRRRSCLLLQSVADDRVWGGGRRAAGGRERVHARH